MVTTLLLTIAAAYGELISHAVDALGVQHTFSLRELATMRRLCRNALGALVVTFAVVGALFAVVLRVPLLMLREYHRVMLEWREARQVPVAVYLSNTIPSRGRLSVCMDTGYPIAWPVATLAEPTLAVDVPFARPVDPWLARLADGWQCIADGRDDEVDMLLEPMVWRTYPHEVAPDEDTELEPVNAVDTVVVDPTASVPSKAPDWLSDAIRLRGEGLSIREVAKRLGRPRETVRRHLKNLEVVA